MAGILDLNDPAQQGLLQAAFSLMSSSGASRLPVSMGQAVGQAGQAGIAGYDAGQQAQIRSMQARKLKMDLDLQQGLTDGAGGGGILAKGMTDPDLMEAVGTRLALAGHPGGAALVNAAEKIRAKRSASATFDTMKSTVQPDPQEVQQAADQGTPAPQPAQGGLFAALAKSPYVGQEAGLLQSQLNAAKDANPEKWMQHYERLSTAHRAEQARSDAATERMLNLSKSTVVVADKSSPTGWSHQDTRTGDKIPGAPPPTTGAAAGEIIPPQHKDLHGDDYLATLPTGMAAMVKKIATGEVDLSKAASMRYGNREAIQQRVIQYDPTYNAQRPRVWQAFMDPNGKTGQEIKAVNTVISHMGTLDELTKAMNNGNTQAVNAMVSAIRTQLGKPEINNAQLAVQAVSNELMRVFRQVNASQHEVEAFEKKFDVAKQSPDQMKGALNTGTELLKGRIDALTDQWTRSMGDIAPPPVMSPKAKAVWERISGGGSSGAAAPAAKPKQRYNPATGQLEAIGG